MFLLKGQSPERGSSKGEFATLPTVFPVANSFSSLKPFYLSYLRFCRERLCHLANSHTSPQFSILIKMIILINSALGFVNVAKFSIFGTQQGARHETKGHGDHAQGLKPGEEGKLG